MQNLDVNDEFYPAMLENITELKNEKLEAVDALLKKRKDVLKVIFIQRNWIQLKNKLKILWT